MAGSAAKAASTSAGEAAQSSEAAETAKQRAEDAAKKALEAKTGSENALQDADAAKNAASGYADAASRSATAAAASEKNAAKSANSAADSAAAAKKSAADADNTANSIKDSMAQISENKEAVSKLKEDIGDIATVGENLFNLNGTRHLNSSIDNNGNIIVGDGIVYELPVDGGTYVSNMPTYGVYKIACISKDGVATIVTPSTTSDFEEHFALPDGTVKAYMSFWSGRDSEVESADYIIFKKGMIVAGNTLPSEYIPYYKNLNNDIKVNESNIKDGTELNKYINTEVVSKEVSDTLFNETSNLIDSSSYVRGVLSTSGVVVESTDDTANYIYTIYTFKGCLGYCRFCSSSKN